MASSGAMLMKPMLRRLRALVPALLLPLGAQAACPPPVAPATPAEMQAAERSDRGFLWRIERDGRRSYLYGTLHVGKPAWMKLGPRVAQAVAQSDVLALELDPGDPAVGAGLNAAGDAPLVLPPALKTRLARQLQAACLPAEALAPMGPALQAVVLGVMEARWSGLDPSYAQEHALASNAHAARRPVIALETVAQQKKVLVPEAPAEAIAMIEEVLGQLESGSGRRIVARLASAWERGDLQTIEDYERWCECARTAAERAALKALNDDRNPALAERIDALHREGRGVFAAVGSLHMTGPQALPKLMAARGYRVERLH
jgi:uncharacterized protein